jgi:trehalose 6-phosphate synthase
MAWTKERLEEVARTSLDDARLIVVGNREPYVHIRDGDGIRCLRPASGVTTALDPVMRACGGTWVAHGSGNADREVCDRIGRVPVPPEQPCYVLRRVWLTPEEEQGYYYGFSNEALWPLCHVAYARPTFRPADWQQYRRVNEKFATAVLEEARDQAAVVFVQDYHFALLPRLLKMARPDLTIVQFWHIPWPNPEVFRICPWIEEVLDGLLGNDLLAFHIQLHCNNFLQTVEQTLEAQVDREHFRVMRGGHATRIRPQPISVDPEQVAALAPADLETAERRVRTHLGIGDRPILVGVDRVDYIKGIPERLRAVDHLLTHYPEWRGAFCLVQVGAPSRGQIDAYQSLQDEVARLTEQINDRHGRGGWRPIVYLNEHYNAEQLYTLYRMAAGCVVTSLHDGMNLVAKEFVAARSDEQGALVLSRFTGAARELTDALLVNPYAVDALAEAFRAALLMPAEEQRQRMRRLRRQVSANNIFRWAGRLLTEAGRLAEATAPRPLSPRLSDRPARLAAHWAVLTNGS